jgi:hypothetical protein
MTAAARPRRTARLLAAAVTMIGLFAMHGLTVGHEPLAAGATPSLAMMQTGSGGHAAHHAGRGDAEHAALAHPGARGVVCAGAGCCGTSGHDECVARLHYVGIDLPQPAMVTTTSVPTGAGPVVVTATEGNRAPPDLTTLCVCRT